MLNSNPPTVDRFNSWPGVKRHLASGVEWQQIHRDKESRTLEAYAATGRIVYTSLITHKEEVEAQPSRSIFLRSPLMMTAGSKLIDSCRDASSHDVQVALAAAVLYEELGSILDFLLESEFPVRHGRNLMTFNVSHAGWLGLAAAVGAMEVVDRFAPLLVLAAREGYVLDFNTQGIQHWILRLWCKVRGLEYPDTGWPRYDVAEGVLQSWNTDDLESLGAWLVQLCNLHTRLSAHRSNMDFSGNFSHFPVEVLMLFRLREQAGLMNPQVDHPIMKFPWSRLWPLKPAEPDELLAGVYRRLEIDEGVTVQGLYRQFFVV